MKSHTFLRFSAVALLTYSLGIAAESMPEEDPNLDLPINNAWGSPLVTPKSLDIDLRSIPTTAAWQAGDAIKDMPRRRFAPDFVLPGAPKNQVMSKIDQLMAAQKTAAMMPDPNFRVVQQVFDGSGFTGVNPPDPTGDVGLNYYIQSINGNSGSIFSVYNKSDGSLVAGPINMETLGSGQCASGAGDPIILFDEMANRWMLSEFSSSGNNLCVYISKTSDPVSGGWWAYAFASPTFPDYPKYGIGPDAYYVGTNETNPTVYAFNRSAMLTGASANFVRLTATKLAGFGFQMITPVDHDGTTAMPTASSGYFLRHRDDEVHNSNNNNPNQDYIELWKFTPDFANTGNSTFTKISDIAVSEFDSSLCGLTAFSCFPQSGSTSDLDPLREPMFRVQYRNFGSYEVLIGNFVTDVNGNDRGGIRWFELRRSNGGAWSLFQEGTYSPDSKNRWMGSIAMDKDGNIALAYSWGSANDFPGIRYTGRLGSDANGTMNQPETILVNGTSGVSSNRWGDYSHLALDPVDECTFWFTGEYGKSGGQWGTHISKFKFDSCGNGGGGGGGNLSPTASFTNTCTDLTCSFDASASGDSDGTISSYAWNFGDGTTATGVTASHTYAASGSYTVTLTVTDNGNASSATSSVVNVTTPGGGGNQLQNGVAVSNLSGPRLDEQFFTMDVPAGATNLKFVISGGSGDADLYTRFGQAPTTSTYDCRPYLNGNSETCSVANPQAGTYHLMIRAYAAYLGVSLTGSYTVAANQSPTASFTDSCTDLDCSFDASASSDPDGSITSYAWDFGDGTTGTGVTAAHSYTADGSYTVQLTVTDNQGATNTSSVVVTVAAPVVNQPPVAAVTSSCTDLTCSFDASTSSDPDGSIVSYAWDFGDGTSGTGVTASHSYAAAGTYGVSVTVTDDQGATNTATTSVTVTAPVNQPPTASFTSNCTDLSCSFDANGSSDSDGNIVSYAWDFGDGSNASGVTTNHSYATAGSYTVSLTVTDDQGATNTSTANVSVTPPANQAPTASFVPSCTDLACSFDASASSDPDGSIASYAWDFGDGTTGSGFNPSHTYAVAGTYNVQLTVTDDQGATASTSGSVTVSAAPNQAPTASFTSSCTDLACSFDASASSDADGSIASYAWNYGDGTTGTGITSSHSFASAGSYDVVLTVTDDQGATGSFTNRVTVTAPPGSGNQLQNAVAVTNLSDSRNGEVFYTMIVPSGATNLKFVISGGSGDADLYVKFGSDPTTASYDCRPYLNGNNETCSINNVQAGTYHVMIRAYAAYSGVSLTGSYTEPGAGGTGGSMSQTNLSGSTGNWDHYTITIPAGMASLNVAMSGGNGDADLYVRQAGQPTTSQYDCRPYKYGNNETCSFNNPTAGTWYISIRAFSSYSGVSLDATWNP